MISTNYSWDLASDSIKNWLHKKPICVFIFVFCHKILERHIGSRKLWICVVGHFWPSLDYQWASHAYYTVNLTSSENVCKVLTMSCSMHPWYIQLVSILHRTADLTLYVQILFCLQKENSDKALKKFASGHLS